MDLKNEQQNEVLCHYCKKPLDQDALYCGSCGIYAFQLPEDLPGNHSWKDDTLGICSYCSKPVPFSRKYCIFCGAPLHLSDQQIEMISRDRKRSVDCRILFHLEELTKQEVSKLEHAIGGYRSIETADASSLSCSFSFQYDEPSLPFANELFFNMIYSWLLDLGKQYPKLRAEATCSYKAKLINRLNNLDAFGGFMTISLSDGVVEQDDTAY